MCCGVAYIVWGREATVAVDELLLSAKGGVMGLGCALHQLEPIAELAMQGRRTVPHRFQAAAPPWSVSGEGGDDDVSAWLHGMAHGTDVPLAILSTGQEVEHGAVVPDIVGVAWQTDRSDVRLQPGDLGGAGAEAFLRRSQRRHRDVQNSDVLKLLCEQIVHQGRSPAPYRR